MCQLTRGGDISEGVIKLYLKKMNSDSAVFIIAVHEVVVPMRIRFTQALTSPGALSSTRGWGAVGREALEE